MFDQFSVGSNILPTTDEHELEEYDWINRGITRMAIELLGGLIDEAGLPEQSD